MTSDYLFEPVLDPLKAEIRRTRWGYEIERTEGLMHWSDMWALTRRGAVRKASRWLDGRKAARAPKPDPIVTMQETA